MKKAYSALIGTIFSISLVFFSASSSAALITYIYEGFDASGSIGGSTFSNVDFTITATADINNISSWCCSPLQNTHVTTSIVIDGFGVASILTASHTWWSNSGLVGLGENLSSNWMTFSSPLFLGYDLASSIGPIFGTALNVSQFNNVSTSLGTLSFSDGRLEGTFQAVTASVSEPAALALLATGLITIAGLRRRKKKI